MAASTGADPTQGTCDATHDTDASYCPFFQHAIEVIGRRWTGSILRTMAERDLRFGEIRQAVPGLSDRLLTARLVELTEEDIVERRDVAGEHRYGLTAKGAALGPVFDNIHQWAVDNSAEVPPALPGRRSGACGDDVEPCAPG